MKWRPRAYANEPTASIASSCTVALRWLKMRSRVSMIWSAQFMIAGFVPSSSLSFCMMTCSTPHSWPCTSACFSRASAVPAGSSKVLWISGSTTPMSCATTSKVSLEAARTRSLMASNALIWTLECSWCVWRWAQCSSAAMVSLKNGDMGEVPPSLPWKPMARWEMAQLTRYATWASSLRDSMRTAMMGGRVSWVMMAGSMSWACRNSKMRPMVQAVVSLTEGWGSFMAWSKKPSACLTVSANAKGWGPSRMEPYAKVAASRKCQSAGVVCLLMLAVMKGMTMGTMSSWTTRAAKPRQVPAAIEMFQLVSSSSCPSSCFSSISSRMGTRWGAAAFIKFKHGAEGSCSSILSASSSEMVLQNSTACSATSSWSSLMALTVMV
mmetsp:Transcript_11625/g.31693  ORF Transcript_11625/g.31693 Transcript_11625/m.31693 type:complete len:381 (-) Transcript_11625:1093-2235(-)